jgi:hypothetical protein
MLRLTFYLAITAAILVSAGIVVSRYQQSVPQIASPIRASVVAPVTTNARTPLQSWADEWSSIQKAIVDTSTSNVETF